MTSYSIARARDRLPRLVHDAEKGLAVELTRRGRPVAVLISASQYERFVKSKPSFWAALVDFRKRAELRSLRLGPRLFKKVRDKSTGREVSR